MRFKLSYKSLLLLVLGWGYACYSLFVYSSNANAPVASVDAQAGKLVFQKYNCIACHQLYGLGGNLGPDLTNSYAKGNGYVKAFLKRGTQTMPNFHLTDDETDALVAFLKYTNTTGSADPRTFTLSPNGTASQNR
jgi:nitric oxide reductase subunit C